MWYLFWPTFENYWFFAPHIFHRLNIKYKGPSNHTADQWLMWPTVIFRCWNSRYRYVDISSRTARAIATLRLRKVKSPASLHKSCIAVFAQLGRGPRVDGVGTCHQRARGKYCHTRPDIGDQIQHNSLYYLSFKSLLSSFAPWFRFTPGSGSGSNVRAWNWYKRWKWGNIISPPV